MTDDLERPTPEAAKVENPDEPVDAAELPTDVLMGDPSADDDTPDDDE